jgi:DNA-binding MarR family transcriptional regulator
LEPLPIWLTRFSRLNAVALEGRSAAHDRTSAEDAVLGALLLAGPILSPTDLTTMVVQSPGGVTKTLRRLEESGFVQRRAAATDRRSLLVVLTPKGRRAAEHALAAMESYFDEVLEELSARERDQLAVLIRKILDRLEPVTGMARSVDIPSGK